MRTKDRYNKQFTPSGGYTILRWGYAIPLLAGAMALRGIPDHPGAGLRGLFQTHSSPAPATTPFLQLTVRTPDGQEAVYTGEKEIHQALNALHPPKKQKAASRHKQEGTEKKTDSVPHSVTTVKNAYIKAQMRTLTDNDPIPYELMTRLAQSESGFDTKAVSNAGAVGLLQLMPKTLLELLYKHKDLLPAKYRAAADAVELRRKNQKQWEKDQKNVAPIFGYSVRAGYNEKKVMNLARNPEVSIILGREYIRTISEELQNNVQERLGNLVRTVAAKYTPKTMKNYARRVVSMRRHLSRPLNYADIKVGYVFGPSGGADFLVALSDPEKGGHRALDYASRSTVNSNPGLFYADPETRTKPRSIKWLYQHFTEKLGNDILPKDLSRPQAAKTVVATTEKPSP